MVTRKFAKSGAHGLAVFLLSMSSCACGSSRAQPDAGEIRADSGRPAATDRDSGAPRDGGDSFDPRQPPCPKTDPPGTVCFEAGWVDVPRWTAAVDETGGDPDAARVYLEAFSLDLHEVTGEQYLEHVVAAGRPPPPDTCGFTFGSILGELVQETSGFTGGRLDDAFVHHPVTCVTRSEAARYCREKGGRLPLLGEWMRAAVGPAEQPRRFPWGDELPELEDVPEFAIVGRSGGRAPGTEAVDSAPRGATARGVTGLSGNVSEWLATCGEDLRRYASRDAIADRPDPTSLTCEKGSVIGGSSWRTRLAPDTLAVSLAPGVIVVTPGRVPEPVFSFLDLPPSDSANAMLVSVLWAPNVGESLHPDAPSIDEGANNRRSWRVGFRCAYTPE